MKAFAKLAALALVAAPAAAVPLPTDSLSPSAPAAIVAAAQSCRDAVPADRLDEQRLTADGWSLAQMREANGRPIDTPLRIFGRESIILLAMPNVAGCTVMARLRSPSLYPAVIQALTAQFGQPAQTNAAGEVMWILGDKAVQAAATGNRERPSVRILIVHVGNSQ